MKKRQLHDRRKKFAAIGLNLSDRQLEAITWFRIVKDAGPRDVDTINVIEFKVVAKHMGCTYSLIANSVGGDEFEIYHNGYHLGRLKDFFWNFV